MKRATHAAPRLLAVILVTMFARVPVGAQRGMTPEDTLRVATVADAQISPDGSAVAYTVSTVGGNETQTEIWLARPSDVRLRAMGGGRIVSGSLNPSRPRWSPDGRRIAFVGGSGEQMGVWVASPFGGGGAPRFVAAVRQTNHHVPYAGEPFAWAPDSRRIAFINATEEHTEPGPADRAYQRTPPDDPRVIDRIQYKSRTGFSDRFRSHVWVVDVDAPAPRQLTFGLNYDHALSWNPRGDEIAFLSNHEPDPDAVNNSDIFAVAVADGRVRQLTSTRGCEYEPVWSPDGKYIAYTATTREVTTIDSVAEDAHVWALEVAGGNRRDLTAAQDRRARSPRWAADSNSVFYLAGDHGRTTIYRVGVPDRRISAFTLWEDRGLLRGVFDSERRPGPALPETATFRPARPSQITSFSVAAKSVAAGPAGSPLTVWAPIAFTLTDAVTPAEVWFSPGAGAPLRRLSEHNDRVFGQAAQFIEPEELNFRGDGDTPVQGWLMKPAGWRPGERNPVILSIHGGPHGAYGYSFNSTFQAYAARGYAVLFINPRGSTGYGQKFSDGTLREWGGGDYKDLMAGVDFALQKYPWLDSNRMAVTGGSYGGFMTNWIITQTPRFRAAVASASVSNLVSFYSTSLYQDLIHAEFGGFPWDDYEQLWRWSPLRYVRDAQTPTLFIHGELDNDVHITQAEEMYTALRRRGVETVLVRYPREGHGLREPRHRLDALERTLWWFDKYLK